MILAEMHPYGSISGFSFDLGFRRERLFRQMIRTVAVNDLDDRSFLRNRAEELYNAIVSGYRAFPRQLDPERKRMIREAYKDLRHAVKSWIGSKAHVDALDRKDESIWHDESLESKSSRESAVLEYMALGDDIDDMWDGLMERWDLPIESILGDLQDQSARDWYRAGISLVSLEYEAFSLDGKISTETILKPFPAALRSQFTMTDQIRNSPEAVRNYVEKLEVALAQELALPHFGSPPSPKPYLVVDSIRDECTFLGAKVSLGRGEVNLIKCLLSSNNSSRVTLAKIREVTGLEPITIRCHFCRIRNKLTAAASRPPSEVSQFIVQLGKSHTSREVAKRSDDRVWYDTIPSDVIRFIEA